MEKQYIGIDAGGTKTEAVLCDEEGRIKKRAYLSAGNPVDIGESAFGLLMKQVRDRLLPDFSIPTAVFLGAAGVSTQQIRKFCLDVLREIFPVATYVDCQNDLQNLVIGGLHGEDGCVIISGTGCNCVIQSRGKTQHIGGWGHLLDMHGSGYDIGRDGVIAALRQLDGYGSKTILYTLLESKWQMPLGDAIPMLYEQSKGKFAALAPLVFEAAEQGDLVALNIIEENMESLASWADIAARQFDGEFEVVVAGGILTKCPLAFRIFCKHLPPSAKAHPMTMEPVFGAVAAAMLATGIPNTVIREISFGR